MKNLRPLLITLGFALSIFAGAEAQAKKQLTIGITQEFENLNPIISQMAASSYIYYTVGHPIASIDADWKWQCWLCTSMPSLENKKARRVKVGGKDKIVAEWEIKENAKWGDGTPVTGHDVRLSWEIGKSPNVSVGSKDIWERVEKVEVDAKNPKKFTLTFQEARYDFYQLGTFFVIPAHIEGPVWEKTKGEVGAYEKQSKYTTEPTNPGLYSGPFVVKEIKLGSHVVVERNPHFYGSPAKFERLVFRLIPNTQTLEANLLSGTIDMVSELGMSFDQALAFEKRVKGNRNLSNRFDVQFRDGMVYEHIDFNLRNPIVKDLKVRQALLYGVDRGRLVEALFEGRQKVALHNIHPLDVYYTDKVEKYDYNPEKAKELLDQAGWKVGAGGIRHKNGERLTLTLMTTAQNKTRELVQVYLQEEWKKIGVDIQIRNEPARVFFGETVRKAAYPHLAMYALDLCSGCAPPFHSPQLRDPEPGQRLQRTELRRLVQ
jgi:peptide/nickel transport system substrate-binding protein